MSVIKNFINDFKQYLISQDMSHNTIKNYLSDVIVFTDWYNDNYNSQIKDITFHDVTFYRDYLISSKRLKASSVNRKVQTLKRFFGFLILKKVIKKDPTTELKNIRKNKSTQPKSLNKNEVHSLLSLAARSAHGTNKRNYAIIQLILQTGLRIGEVVNLQFQDIILSDRSGQIRVVDGKGHKG